MRSLITLSASALVLSLPAMAQNARPAVPVSPLAASPAPVVCVDDATGAYMLLCQDSTSTTLVLHKSRDKGRTWDAGTPVSLTAGAKFINPDSLWCVDGFAYVGWTCDSGAGAGEDFLFFAKYDIAACAVVTPETVVADGGGLPGTSQIREYNFEVTREPTGGVSFAFAIRVDPGAAAVNDQLYVSASRDCGLTGPGFSAPPVYIPPFAAGAFDVDQIDLCADGGQYFLAWGDNSAGGVGDDVWIETSAPGTAGFVWPGPTVPVSITGTTDQQDDVSVACRAQKVLVTWPEERPTGDDFLAARVFDVTLAALTPVTSPQASLADVDNCVAAVTFDRTLIIAYDDFRTGVDNIQMAVSKDCGMTWTDTTVSPLGDAANFPRLVAGRDRVVACAWTQDPFPQVGGSAYSCDDGCTWTYVVGTTTTGDADFVELALDDRNKNVFLGWLSDDTGPNLCYSGGYSLCKPASVLARNSGSNPASLTSSTMVLGGTWTVTVDLTTTGHSTAVLFGFDTPLPGLVLAGGQTLLCIDSGSGELLTGAGKAAAGPMAMFSCPIPNDPCLSCFTLCVQAIHAFGVVPFALSNALDLTVGSN